MSIVLLCGVSGGLLCGWLMLHWLVLGVLSLGIIVVSLSISLGLGISILSLGIGPWYLLLIPKLFGILTLFQMSFLVGAAARLWWDERRSYRAAAVRSADTILDGERILVVEDDPLTAAVIAGEIEAASGRPVGPATSVADALRQIEEGAVEGAVLDLKLLDGAATPVALKLIDRSVPFVIVSALAAPREILERDPNVPVFKKPVRAAVPIRSLAGEMRHARQHKALAG